MSKLKKSLRHVYPQVEDKLYISTSSQLLKTPFQLVLMTNVVEAYNTIPISI
jgi:hypothetical protein